MEPIPDKKIVEIPVKDNGEEMIHINHICSEIKINIADYIKKEGKKYSNESCLVRKSVASKLKLAQSFLPSNYNLVVRCGYRPLNIQKKRYDWMYNKLKNKNPYWDSKKFRNETSKCIAPIDIIPPHSTGGAVDLTILDSNDKQLDMGTKLGEFNEKTYTDSNKISSKSSKNRDLLISVMSKAGFINYPTEWWHWSYGDRYWAAVSNKKYSIYSGV